MRLLTSDLMVCCLSSSKTVRYADKRNTQEAWVVFDIASISDALCEWSSYAFFFETHTPAEVRDLLIRNDAIAKEFKANTRTYNSALSFTSMNADLDIRYANEMHGAYAFRIHGSVHHLVSSELIPNPNNIIQQPRFAQIYIFDSANELQNRMNVAGNPDVRPETMLLLQGVMHRMNPFVD